MLSTFLSLAEKACSEYHVCVEPDTRRCRDAYFGTVGDISSTQELVPHTVEEGLKRHLPGRIVYVLESPHKDEYVDKELEEVWPIKGKSGENLRMFSTKIIPDAMNDWGTFVVNAIQYQCSQGLCLERGFNRAAKNYVVGNLLQLKEFRDDLRDRVRPFFSRKDKTPCMLLNACTSYVACNVGKANKILVNEILAPIDGVRIFNDITHPSCWKRQQSKSMNTWQSRILEMYSDIRK